jgi:hypothetical protein
MRHALGLRIALVSLLLTLLAGPLAAEEALSAFVPDQRPPTLVSKSADGKLVLDEVRLGYDDLTDCRNSARFGQVTIDPGAVEDVVFVIKPFAPEWMAAHVFFYFTFPADRPVVGPDGETSRGLAVSVEARLRRDQRYDLFRGMGKEFLIVYQVSMIEDDIKRCAGEGKRMLRYSLKFSPEQRRQLVLNALDASLKNRDGEYYNTYNNNCTNSAIAMLNTVLPEKQRFRLESVPGVKSMFISLPRWIDLALRAKGLVRERLPDVIPSAEAEVLARGPAKLKGEALEAAIAQAKLVRASIEQNTALVLEALQEGNLDAKKLEFLLWDASSESVPWFEVPGVTSDEKDPTHHRVGREFPEGLQGALSSDVESLYRKLATAYVEAACSRMLLDGPELTVFLLERERLLAGQLRSASYVPR